MAKTKQNWIDEVKAFGQEALGDVSDDDLNAMQIGQLKALKKELEKETGKTEEPAAGKQEEGKLEELPKSQFISMCGSEYDPKKSGSCAKQCNKDFPEAFKACSENFAAKASVGTTTKTKKTKAPATGGKTIWNHVASSQAGLIDECIIGGKQMTLAEIAAYAKAKEPRTLNHIQHLVADWKITILTDKRKVGEEEKVYYFWKDKCPGAVGEPVAGKSAYKS